MIDVKIEGLPQLLDTLASLQKSAERTVLRRAATSALQLFVDEAKAIVTVDDGDVRDSLIVAPTLSRGARAARRGQPKDGVTVYAGPASGTPGIKYASFLEFGTYHAGAQPFMRPAFDRVGDQMIVKVGEELRVEIDRATARAQRSALRAARKK